MPLVQFRGPAMQVPAQVFPTLPQSMSVSPSFLTPSEHVAGAHFDSAQTSDWQSLARTQPSPSGHAAQSPPQSMSVSPLPVLDRVRAVGREHRAACATAAPATAPALPPALQSSAPVEPATRTWEELARELEWLAARRDLAARSSRASGERRGVSMGVGARAPSGERYGGATDGESGREQEAGRVAASSISRPAFAAGCHRGVNDSVEASDGTVGADGGEELVEVERLRQHGRAIDADPRCPCR